MTVHALVCSLTPYRLWSVLFHWSEWNVGCLSSASVQWCQTFNMANKPCHGNPTQRPENNALYSMVTWWRETAGGQGYWPLTCLQRRQIERWKHRAAKGQSSIIRIARGCVYFEPVIIRTALDTMATCITCWHFYSTERLLLEIMAEWTLHCLQNMTVKSVNEVEVLTCFENTTCGQTALWDTHAVLFTFMSVLSLMLYRFYSAALLLATSNVTFYWPVFVVKYLGHTTIGQICPHAQ